MKILVIKASIRVQSKESLPVVRDLVAGWGPTIVIGNRTYIGRVTRCDTPIPPGHDGFVEITMLDASKDDIQDTKYIALYAATDLIASGIIMSVVDEKNIQ